MWTDRQTDRQTDTEMFDCALGVKPALSSQEKCGGGVEHVLMSSLVSVVERIVLVMLCYITFGLWHLQVICPKLLNMLLSGQTWITALCYGVSHIPVAQHVYV